MSMDGNRSMSICLRVSMPSACSWAYYMSHLLRVIRAGPLCAMTNLIFGHRRGAIFLAYVAIASMSIGCDSHRSSRNIQLQNGWVTNCEGPVFSKYLQNANAGPGFRRPIFGINDQLVLAVPEQNMPSANSIENEPPECKQIGDLPRAAYLTFVIWGDWSAGYKPEDVPTAGGSKQFKPDVVSVRIEQELPSTLSIEEQQKMERLLLELQKRDSIGTLESGGLTCFIPKPAVEWFHCSGRLTKAYPDVTKIMYRKYSATPFVLVLADYPSSRYGGIHLYWKAWILDVANARNIDLAIWKSIEDWNLVNKPGAQAAQH